LTDNVNAEFGVVAVVPFVIAFGVLVTVLIVIVMVSTVKGIIWIFLVL
jgi:hypothetical protein